MRATVMAAALCAALPARALTAQQATGPSVAPATAVRADRAPVIDGREDDPVWQGAPATSEFLEFKPNEGKAPRFRTEFKAAYDERNLYVFVRAFDSHPDSIMTALTRRDVRGPSDQLKVMIDSYDDRLSGFEFAVNPVGVKRDYAMYNDRDEDETWDGIWDVGTRIDSTGWTAEFRIPFSQLRYANSESHTFGFGIWRDIERYKERTSWPLYRSSQSGISSQLGKLVGVRGIASFHRLELVPYVVAKNLSVPVTSPVDATGWNRSQRLTAGADLKYGITPNLTLDATVNPDFGQVEADPSVVNLTAFETFFEERRPFFIEGTGLYNYQLNCSIVNCRGEGLFYSRRIGRTPQLLNKYGDRASPNVTPILGATKLTGRVRGGLNVGLLEAVTGRVVGTAARTTEPVASYTVLRAQEDMREGRTNIGAIVTGVNRALDQWTDTLLHHDAWAAGTNIRQRWGASKYEATASLTGSMVNGSRQAIAATQTRGGVHLYQRPDAGLPLDSTRTSLIGDAEDVSFGKFGGNMVHFQTSWQRQSPGFEVNDLGYLRRANQQSFNNWMGLSFMKPTRVYRQMSGNFNAWGNWTSAGLPTERAVNTNWHVNLQNNTWVHAGFTLSQLGTTYCDNCARGGPALHRSPLSQVNVFWQGDDRKHVVPGFGVYDARGDYGRSHYVEVSPELTLIPMSQLQVDITGGWSMNHDDSQWFDNFREGAVTHYTFAHLDQETRSLGLRASYTATPTLSLQLYAAPFLSRGRYSNVRELSSTPRAARYEDRYVAYSAPASASMGFDILELRSNNVLRWEFRPGSTFFAVWSHGRGGDAYDPRYPTPTWRNEYSNLFGLHPENTFLVKLAWWWGE